MGMKRRQGNLLGRYATFLAGATVAAVGIAFITRAGLGTSPVSSIPLVLSLITPPTMGVYTFFFNMVFLVGEALLRREFTLPQLLQIPATLFFSACIDRALDLIPTRYGGAYLPSLAYLAIGCAVMALGIALEVKADVIMLPAEAFVRALARRLDRDFGRVKVGVDTAVSAVAAVVALAAFHRLNGVREGTLISALAVGRLVNVFTKLLSRKKAPKQDETLSTHGG